MRSATFVDLRPTLYESTLPVMAGRFLCRLRLHKWTERKNSNNEIYFQCLRCGKDRYDPEANFVAGETPPFV